MVSQGKLSDVSELSDLAVDGALVLGSLSDVCILTGSSLSTASSLLLSLGERVILSLVSPWILPGEQVLLSFVPSLPSSLGVPGHLFLLFLLSRVAAGEARQLPRSEVSRATLIIIF